jgi:uncharacterized protein (TIGR03435 family)
MSRIAVTVFVAMTCVAILAAQQPAPRFEVASIKRTDSQMPSGAPIPRAQPGGRFRADIATVVALVWFAYGWRNDFVVGGPDWVRKDRFEISAKAENDAPAAEVKLMVQSLLKDRFKLVTHIEQREMRFQAIIRARPNGPLGPDLVSIDECSATAVNKLRREFPEKYPTPGGGMVGGCSSMGLGDLATLLSIGGTPVIDATGLTGSFYYTIRSQLSLAAAFTGRTANVDPNLPALSTALDEQLGLKLESRRGPLDVLVIDSVQEPTPD